MRTTISVAGTALAALSMAACGSTSTTPTGGLGQSAVATSTQNVTAASEVPAAIKAKGTLMVAADASYAPNEYVGADGKTVQGMDADLAKALGQQLGLQVTVQNINFDSIIPGLSSGKFDLGMSSFTDTKVREQTVDFVTYFNSGTEFFVAATGGPSINTLDDLCGHKVSVEKGTTQLDDANAQNTKCTQAGKAAVTVQAFPDQNGANLALSSGRADVSMADQPVADYQVKQSNGVFKISGQAYGQSPYGIAIPKGTGMAKPLLDALKALIQQGTYKSILDNWGISSGAITAPVINGATS